MFAPYKLVLGCHCLASRRLLSAYPTQSEMLIVDLQLRGWQSLGSLLVHRIVRVAPTATTLQALLAGVSLPLSL
jgi:hypothetical protein